MTSKQRESAVTLSWHGVYCLCVDLYATALLVLKFSFLEDAFHFLGVHQDRMLQVQLPILYNCLIILVRENNSYRVDFWWKDNDRWFLWMYFFDHMFMHIFSTREWFDMYLHCTCMCFSALNCRRCCCRKMCCLKQRKHVTLFASCLPIYPSGELAPLNLFISYRYFPGLLASFFFIPLILMVALPSVWLKFNKYVLELSKCVFKNLNAT